jgi:DNA invertase Pin-like site-specific DNA recombinase
MSAAKLRVVTYARVSTVEQSNDGLSLEAQRTRMRAWVELTGAVIVNEIVDAAVSGTKPLAQRPGGAQVADLLNAKTPQAEAVVVVRLDRLGRDAAESLALFKRFRAGKVGLVSLAEQVDLATAHGRAMAGVQMVFAELERALIAQRTIDALSELKRQGRAWNHPPFGWDVRAGRLVPNAPEQRVIVRIRDLRASGFSYRAIAHDLAATGVSTKRGGVWAAATVRHLLLAQPDF